MWPKHTLYQEPSPGSSSETAWGFPFMPTSFHWKPHWQVPLEGDAWRCPCSDSVYKKVALEKVSVFLMPPLYSKCATSKIAITTAWWLSSDSPCTVTKQVLFKTYKKWRRKKDKNIKIILKRWYHFLKHNAKLFFLTLDEGRSHFLPNLMTLEGKHHWWAWPGRDAQRTWNSTKPTSGPAKALEPHDIWGT